MMLLHSKLLGSFTKKFKDKIEKKLLVEIKSSLSTLSNCAINGGLTDSLTDTLGTSFTMLNNLHQLEAQL